MVRCLFQMFPRKKNVIYFTVSHLPLLLFSFFSCRFRFALSLYPFHFSCLSFSLSLCLFCILGHVECTAFQSKAASARTPRVGPAYDHQRRPRATPYHCIRRGERPWATKRSRCRGGTGQRCDGSCAEWRAGQTQQGLAFPGDGCDASRSRRGADADESAQ